MTYKVAFFNNEQDNQATVNAYYSFETIDEAYKFIKDTAQNGNKAYLAGYILGPTEYFLLKDDTGYSGIYKLVDRVRCQRKDSYVLFDRNQEPIEVK